jgi:hypothetical protein
MSDLEQLRPCESADIYNAAPHNALGALPVCEQYQIKQNIIRLWIAQKVSNKKTETMFIFPIISEKNFTPVSNGNSYLL